MLHYFPFDGVVLFHTNIDPKGIIELCNRHNIPIVIIGRTIESPRIHCININRENAMYQTAKYLISLNHKDIAYISGPPELELSKARLRGIQRALSEVGLTLKSLGFDDIYLSLHTTPHSRRSLNLNIGWGN